MKLENGKTYTINHSRKGTFTGRLESDHGEFVVVTIISEGSINGLINVWNSGEEMVVRKEFATFDGERAE